MFTRQYTSSHLECCDLDESPIKQFDIWLREASKKQADFANTMTLATVDADGAPDARILLLKEVKSEGLIFFTNYESVKAQQLAQNARAVCVFWWPELERQVRVRGVVDKISSGQSDAYFKTRPRGSQIGAWVSRQSQVLRERSLLETCYEEREKKFTGQEIPRPENWGGYCLKPTHFEFWQGRDNRLHDRFEYELDSLGQWVINRLAP